MILKQQIELNVCREYIRRVEQRFPEPIYEAQKFLLILQIYEWQLKRYLRRIPLELHQLGTLKHGIRSAERLLQEISGGELR